jgi:hypothetical protein
MAGIEGMRERGEVDLTEEDASLIATQALAVTKILANINTGYKELRYDLI